MRFDCCRKISQTQLILSQRKIMSILILDLISVNIISCKYIGNKGATGISWPGPSWRLSTLFLGSFSIYSVVCIFMYKINILYFTFIFLLILHFIFHVQILLNIIGLRIVPSHIRITYVFFFTEQELHIRLTDLESLINDEMLP